MASREPPTRQHRGQGVGQGGNQLPTSFDSSQWRQLLPPVLMVLTSQESRILMPSVASLPEELLLLDQGGLASVLGGRASAMRAWHRVRCWHGSAS
uniref:Uncharacterized protein n=1 Tax=Prolemur simus TaxID=1328070 RepID=A0A8C8ZQN8_PROSS